MNNRQIKGSAACLSAAVIWGLTFVAQSTGMDNIGPFTFMVFRCIVASIVMVPFTGWNRSWNQVEADKSWRYERKWGLPLLAILGVLSAASLFVAMSLQQVSLLYTTVGRCGFLTAMYVVIVPLLRLAGGRKPSLGLCVCVALVVVGLFLLCNSGEGGVNRGDVLAFLCAVAYAFDILILDWVSPHIGAVQMNWMRFTWAGIFCLPFMLLTETVTVAGVLSAMGPILYAGVMSSGIAYTLQIVGQQNSDPAIASVLMCMESVFAVIGGWVILGQSLSGRELVGCAVMLVAIVLCQLPGVAEPKK